jgi:hypothetical protein
MLVSNTSIGKYLHIVRLKQELIQILINVMRSNKSITLKIALSLLIFCILSQPLNASLKWGATGHRAVGAIADNYLDASAKRKIKKLLNRQSLAFASTFADEIKSDKRYREFYTWHYINMPFEVTYENSVKNTKGYLVS